MKEALGTQVFIHVWPVDAESSAGHAPIRALLARRRKQTGVPHERHRDRTAVQEIDD